MKKHFLVGQRVIWKVTEFNETTRIKAVVTEVHQNHVIATTEGNNNSYDNLTLWIDAENENDYSILK